MHAHNADKIRAQHKLVCVCQELGYDVAYNKVTHIQLCICIFARTMYFSSDTCVFAALCMKCICNHYLPVWRSLTHTHADTGTCT